MELTVESWVGSVFDHQAVKPEWPPSAPVLQIMADLFEHSEAPLRRFSDEQLNQGFWSLCQGGGPMQALEDERISWELRLRAIRSFVPLFRDLFATRCDRHLSHLDRTVQAELCPLNSACYMWWDFDCWVAKPSDAAHRRVDAAFLDAMREILKIGHEACQESALHGLGHWHHAYPAETARIIEEFLAAGELREELLRYAQNAQRGCVL